MCNRVDIIVPSQVAVNQAGPGTASAAQFVQLEFVPGVPALVISKFSSAWADVSWSLPAAPGEAGALVGFNVTVSSPWMPETSVAGLTTAMSLRALGLRSSAAYNFHVYAVYATKASGSYGAGVAEMQTTASPLVTEWTSATGFVTTGAYMNDQTVQFVIRPVGFVPVGVVLSFSLFDVEVRPRHS